MNDDDSELNTVMVQPRLSFNTLGTLLSSYEEEGLHIQGR